MNRKTIDAGHLDFSGKRVLVTGAAGGIGSEMARVFGAHGARLLLADRDCAGLQALREELGEEGMVVEVTEFEQTDTQSLRALTAWAEPVDVFLNNAGILRTGPLLDATCDDAREVLETNLLGPIQLAMGIGARMTARGSGVIVNTASQLAFTGAATRALYASAKAGLVQFTRSAAAEWGPCGVRVVALAPGRTLTALNRHLLDDPDELAASLQRIPARRIGDATEMARLALLLASPLCDYVVGETLIADGGYILE